MTTTKARRRFLDLRALEPLARLRFATRQRIEGAYSGRHASQQQGGAGEFVDFREYSAGEDLRRVDWKVLARTGRAYVRLFQDETNLRCLLVLDASGSMRYGDTRWRGGSKLDYVQHLATALAYVIARGQDQVGLAVLSDRLEAFLPPGATETHLAQVYDAVENLQTRPAPRMAEGLRQMFRRVGRRGVLLLMSDFLSDDVQEVFGALRLFRHRQWEVVVLHVVHPDEERLPDGTAFRLEGLEGEGRVLCSPDAIREAYVRRFAQHLASVRTLALSTGCDYRLTSTAVPYLHALRGFLVERTG